MAVADRGAAKALLAMLLENLGTEEAVRLGRPRPGARRSPSYPLVGPTEERCWPRLRTERSAMSYARTSVRPPNCRNVPETCARGPTR
jgi:hypothetical protein